MPLRNDDGLYHCDDCATVTGCGCFDCYRAHNVENHNSDDYYYDESEEYYDEEESRGVMGLLPWDYRPLMEFHGEEGAPYHVGAELEISAPYRANLNPIHRWARTNGVPELLYCKSDGSVEGFEIVTHPMTHGFFESVNWQSFFAVLNENYDAPYGMDECEGHGIHVHVSRTAFRTPLELCRWTYLLNHNRRHLNRIARRNNSRWAAYSDSPVTGAWQNAQYRHGKGIPYSPYDQTRYVRRMVRKSNDLRDNNYMQSLESDRYRATNLTNMNTVEVRVFRSTRRWEDFTAAVRTVVASVEYVRSIANDATVARIPSWEGFTAFTENHETLKNVHPVLSAATTPRRRVSVDYGYAV